MADNNPSFSFAVKDEIKLLSDGSCIKHLSTCEKLERKGDCDRGEYTDYLVVWELFINIGHRGTEWYNNTLNQVQIDEHKDENFWRWFGLGVILLRLKAGPINYYSFDLMIGVHLKI